MTRFAPLLAAGLLLAPACLTSSPPAAFAQSDAADPALAEDAVALIPAEAGVVVRIADPDSAITHVSDFVKNSAPQFAGFVQQARVFLGIGVNNPTLSGINLKRPWYVVMVPKADAKPATVFLLPVANAQAAEESVGPNFTFKVLGTYLAYSEDADALESFGEGGKIADALPKGTMEMAADADITIFVNAPALRETYADGLNDGFEMIQQQAATQAATPEAMKQQEQVFAFMKQVIEDADGLSIGLSASADRLTVKKIFQVAAGTDAAKALAAQSPAKFAALDKLPEALDGYFAFEGDIKPLVEAVSGLAPASDESIADTMKAFAEAGFEAAAGGFKLGGGGEPLLSGVQVTMMEDMSKAKSATEQYLTQSNGQTQNGLKTTVETTGTVDVAGLSMTTYSTSVEAVEQTPEAQQGEAFFNMIFDGSLEQKVGYTADAVVQVLAGDDAFAEEVVSHVNGSSGHTNEPLDAARKLVPAQGNLFGAIDLAAVIQSGLAAAAESGQIPIPVDAATVRGIDVESDYAVFVVIAKDRVLESTAVLPATTVRNIADMAMQLQGGAQGF